MRNLSLANKDLRAHLGPLMEKQYERWYTEETNIVPKDGTGHQLYKELRTRNQLWEIQEIYGPFKIGYKGPDQEFSMIYGTWFDMKKRLMHSLDEARRMGFNTSDLSAYVVRSKKGGFDAYANLTYGYDHEDGKSWQIGDLLTERFWIFKKSDVLEWIKDGYEYTVEQSITDNRIQVVEEYMQKHFSDLAQLPNGSRLIDAITLAEEQNPRFRELRQDAQLEYEWNIQHQQELEEEEEGIHLAQDESDDDDDSEQMDF
jgi:hypothetical protein